MKRKKTLGKNLLAIVITLAIFVVLGLGAVYQMVLSNNIPTTTVLYIPQGAILNQVYDSLQTKVNSLLFFKLVSRQLGYEKKVKSGRYVLESGMNNFQLVQKLKAGDQDPTKLRFISTRTKTTFSESIASQLEFSSEDLYKILVDPDFTASFNLDTATITSIFIPNTYFVYWDISPENFVKKMYREYQKFWNEKRLTQAKDLGLTPTEVITLASIVQEETNKNDEKPMVASVYLNRLNKGMLLQADPTVKYAYGDFSLRRILKQHLSIDSPYNTYQYKGLPPGPICIPDISSIDAVLKGQKTPYIYFCANADLSGSHTFATNYSDHQANARKYHRMLNARKIR